VGKQADFITINLESLETVPVYNPISHLVYCIDRNNVADVWVSGRQLMKERKLLSLDEQEIIQNAIHWSQKIATETQNSK